MLRNPHVRFGGRRLETQVKLCAGRLPYFVIAWNGTKENAQKLKDELSAFLSENLGLELSEEKTHITHITEGFDFLGFTMKRHADQQRGKNSLRFYPSEKSVMKIKGKIKSMTKRGTTLASPRDKITALNLLLKGWANYYRHSSASSTFSLVGNYAYKRMELWLRKKTKKRVGAIYKKYYRKDKWFTWEAGGKYLYHTSMTTIEYKRYSHRPNLYLNPTETVEISYHLDPYPGKRKWDGIDSRYGEDWSEKRDEIKHRDGNQCVLCGSQDRVEIHHIRKHKGNNKHIQERLIALCASCHRKVRNQQSEVSRLFARIDLRTGEPDEAKVSRPVREEA